MVLSSKVFSQFTGFFTFFFVGRNAGTGLLVEVCLHFAYWDFLSLIEVDIGGFVSGERVIIVFEELSAIQIRPLRLTPICKFRPSPDYISLVNHYDVPSRHVLVQLFLVVKKTSVPQFLLLKFNLFHCRVIQLKHLLVGRLRALIVSCNHCVIFPIQRIHRGKDLRGLYDLCTRIGVGLFVGRLCPHFGLNVYILSLLLNSFAYES